MVRLGASGGSLDRLGFFRVKDDVGLVFGYFRFKGQEFRLFWIKSRCQEGYLKIKSEKKI